MFERGAGDERGAAVGSGAGGGAGVIAGSGCGRHVKIASSTAGNITPLICCDNAQMMRQRFASSDLLPALGLRAVSSTTVQT